MQIKISNFPNLTPFCDVRVELTWVQGIMAGRTMGVNMQMEEVIPRHISNLGQNLEKLVKCSPWWYSTVYYTSLETINILLISPNFGLNWGYDVTEGDQIWKFGILTCITEFSVPKLIYMIIFNGLLHFIRKILTFLLSFPNFGLNWGHDVTKGGPIWKI